MSARVAGCFVRVEPRLQARAYLRGLLAPVERKNSWQLAEAAGYATPDSLQRLLNAASWDADKVRDALCAYVVEHLGEPDVGVERHRTGATSVIDHCQLVVHSVSHSVVVPERRRVRPGAAGSIAATRAAKTS